MENAPKSHCGLDEGNPYTTVDVAPVVVEKPYIVMTEGGKYSLMVPRVEINKRGPTPNYDNADEIPFENVFVAADDICPDNCLAKTINEKLAAGLDVVLQPGIYHLEDSITINNANAVLLGVGLATLMAPPDKPCVQVGDVDGVKVSGLLLQATDKEHMAPALLQWGSTKGYAGNSAAPGAVHDVFARVGADEHIEVAAETMFQINSGNVIVDDTWLWRGDHTIDGLIYNSKNHVRTGFEVNGDDVIAYGLAVEHTLGHLVEWNGENGRTYFYQSELPYDVDHDYADNGYTGYKVADNVQKHEAWGLGVYSNFRDHLVETPTGIKVPKNVGINFHNSLSVKLASNGGIKHVINDQGDEVNDTNTAVAYVCEYNGAQHVSEMLKVEAFLQ